MSARSFLTWLRALLLPRRQSRGRALFLRPAALAAGSLVACVVGSGCQYLGTVAREGRYALRQQRNPEQRVYKHMLTRQTFYVFGVIRPETVNVPADLPLAVAAIAAGPVAGEVVDVNHVSRAESYYGLNLPDGSYQLVVLADANRDGFYEPAEAIAVRPIDLSEDQQPDRVCGDIDLELPPSAPRYVPPKPFRIAVPRRREAALAESLFYPKGSIRSLDDPIFSPAMAQLGLYRPAAFLERAPMMFYALEEDSFRVPVVFVHGIGGSARDFADIVSRLDRTYYKPWFFHYASGTDLTQLSAMFHRIFLSGKVVPLGPMPLVIVAHSMGGLVVRDALNRCTGKPGENTVACLVTIGSPFGGHPSAKSAAHAPLVIPSWADLNPDSAFIRDLHRRPLPSALKYHLLYTFADDRTLKLGETGDGVVPLGSQLVAEAQREATVQFGCNATHTGVLQDPGAVARVIAAIEAVKSPLPAEHVRELQRGGYALPPDERFTLMEAFYVRNLGWYLDALASGRLQPADPFQRDFVAACRGERRPRTEPETAWRKLNEFYPERARLLRSVSGTPH
ncbi:DUF413 domain-containing protein [Opitutus sp. ER46]|uniref:DUF413 domain-containing protein n=1 Tax=Opitutus sp. ER46 TaxID=2161864 RepID=UPI0011B282E6|nr:DUF413 domain-containing protein [Opitutus sp. ER46]